jgi:hypothetical protein
VSAACDGCAVHEAAELARAHDAALLDPRVIALGEMCTCGHDWGDHLVDAPHACEHDGACDRGCAGFVALRGAS